MADDSSSWQRNCKALVSSLAVAHAQDTHNPSTEKPLIQCYKCGEPCKGEVLRVQNKHFHLKCFTCKGTLLCSSSIQNIEEWQYWKAKDWYLLDGTQFNRRFGVYGYLFWCVTFFKFIDDWFNSKSRTSHWSSKRLHWNFLCLWISF